MASTGTAVSKNGADLVAAVGKMTAASSIEIDATSIAGMDREELVAIFQELAAGGISLIFNGKKASAELLRKVRPRSTRRVTDLHVGTPIEQANNLLIEGENLQAMVTLYKYRGAVDLILTDPPYNTGKDFRYNDRWIDDPNDPDLGSIVLEKDPSKHTKWLRFMYPRLKKMYEMLKPSGVLAICIDYRELFNLGEMLDEIFDRRNRLAVINWEKSYTRRNDKQHVSSATEYVLVYAKDKDLAKTQLLDRTEQMDARYSSPDGDPRVWQGLRATAPSAKSHKGMVYAVQSPFTGLLHYPQEGRCWINEKRKVKQALEQWGSKYEERDIDDGHEPSLVIVGAPIPDDKNFDNHPKLRKARAAANAVLEKGNWPAYYWGNDGLGVLSKKTYLEEVKKGYVPTTFWSDENYDDPLVLDSVSWEHEASGHSNAGMAELTAIVGPGHGFETVKPLKLFRKIIQIWGRPDAIVMDPFAGSGTTGHAILELNAEERTNRRFILIEQGRPENGDKYARTLTWTRLRNAITGKRPKIDGKAVKGAPLGGGFEFRMLTSQIDAKAVMAMRRDELIDVIITSHFSDDRRNSRNLVRVEDPKYRYLMAQDDETSEGFFVILDGDGPVGQVDLDSYRAILNDAKKFGLAPPYHVYARYEIYQSPNVRFYKIPDKVLAHLGFNENMDAYNGEEAP